MGNEEKWVEQWSKSVLKADPDLVVVNVNGYEDNTEQLLRDNIPEEKLLLVKFPWKKSFSEARNHTFDAIYEYEEKNNVIFDYYFFIDADEVLKEDAYKKLDEFLRIPNENLMARIDIYNDVGDGSSQTAYLFFPRMFPLRDIKGKKLNPRFESEVHNQLVYPRESQPDMLITTIGIWHYGYALSAEEMDKKHRRSEELLRAQVEEDPENPFTRVNLAQLLRAKGDHAGTIENAQKAIDIVAAKNDDPRFLNMYIMAQEQLASALNYIGRFEESIEASKAALAKKNDHLDSIINIAQSYLELHVFEQAKYWCERYLFIRSRYDENRDQTNLILNHLNSSFLALYYLGTVHALQGNYQKAYEFYKRSYNEEPAFRDTFIKLIHTMNILGLQKEVHVEINNFIRSYPDKQYMVYDYYGNTELEDGNVEGAKFNFYQGGYIDPDNPKAKYIRDKYEALESIFGSVAPNIYKTQEKVEELKNMRK